MQKRGKFVISKENIPRTVVERKRRKLREKKKERE